MELRCYGKKERGIGKLWHTSSNKIILTRREREDAEAKFRREWA